MDDMDKEAIELGGNAKFFSEDYEKYSWDNLFNAKVTAHEMLKLYSESIESMEKNPYIPQLFRDIFKNAYLPYRDPETLKLFLKTIGEFEYTHSEKLGDAFEYLLSIMGSQGDAGQFRTPRHIIDFLVKAVNPQKTDTILDPACGTAGFLVSAFKYIKDQNHKKLTPDERKKLIKNFIGYDISPDMVRMSLVNLYLHGFSDPHIFEYDSLTNEDRWGENFDVVLANPPFMSPKGGIRPHKRFTVTSNRSEVLFVDYITEHLRPNGRAGVIVPEGIIFQSGKAYKQLRKMLVENYLYAVVSLPAGVFNPYSGVKTSILLMDKTLAKKTDKILFVKIDNDGYNLGAQRNVVKGGQLDEAINIINNYKLNIEKTEDFEPLPFAHAVEKTKIAGNGEYNLSGERYKIAKSINHSDFKYYKLLDISEIKKGSSITKKLVIEGDIPVIAGGQNPAYYHNEPNRFGKTITVSSSGAYAGFINYFEQAIFASDCTTIQTDNKLLNTKFLYHLLKHEQNAFYQLQKGGAQPHVYGKDFGEIEIPLPPLSVQEEIVAEIEGYQKIIDGAKMVVDNYKPHIDIDPDWEMVELGEVCKPQYGYTEKAKDQGEVRFIRITDIDTDGKLKNTDAKYIDLTKEAEKSIVMHNDILLARTGATYGKTMIYKEDYTSVFASFLMRLNFDTEKVFPKYYWVFAQSENYISQAASLMTGGAQPQFNGNAIVKIKIPLPNIEVQQKLVKVIEKEIDLVNSSKQLIAIFEQKIKDRIAKVWGSASEDEVGK